MTEKVKRKIFLIGNPVAGGGSLAKIHLAAKFLQAKGHDAELRLTRKKGDAELFAAEIGKGGHENALLIAAGGDGTYNEIANGLAYSEVPMAILPLGTTSVLAHEIGVPYEIEKALEIALDGTVRTINLGKITNSFYNGRGRYFLLMAGIGFDGETVFGVKEHIKKITGKGAYILSGIFTFLRYDPSSFTIRFDNLPVVEGYNAIISKAACYGGHYKITPEANLEEPYLYAFVTHKIGRFNLLKYVSGIVKGRPAGLNDATYSRAVAIEVSGRAHIQIDGDYAGTAPAKIEVVTDALKLVFGN